jgi:hypothetical protein
LKNRLVWVGRARLLAPLPQSEAPSNWTVAEHEPNEGVKVIR